MNCKTCKKVLTGKQKKYCSMSCLSKGYYWENREERLKKVKLWRINNPEKKRDYGKQYREINKEKLKIKQQEYRKKNEEKVRLYNVKRYQENKELFNNRHRKWQQNNPEKVRIIEKRYKEKHPERAKAKRYAHNHKQRRPFCLLHLLEGKEIPSQGFHHTDYESRMGFSVCRKHHTEADIWRKNLNG